MTGKSVSCRLVSGVLPRGEQGSIDLSSEVELTHLRIEKQSEGRVVLPEGGGDVVAVFGGHGRLHDPNEETLSTIIDQINERFGLELTEHDKLLFDQYEQSWLEDGHLGDQARNNDLDNFRLVFGKVFMDTIVRRMDANEEIFKKILDDDTFRSYLLDHYVGRVYQGHREITT